MKIRIIFLLIPLLFGCREKVVKAIIDKVGRAQETVYSYEYDGIQKKITTIIDYTIIAGARVDSFISTQTYTYNENNFLIQEFSILNNDDTISTIIYERNSLDSLIRELYILDKVDTMRWTEYNSFPDGMKEVYNRRLLSKAFSDENYDAALMSDSYDTIYTVTKYRYEDSKCIISERFDEKMNLNSKSVYKYEEGKISQSYFISYFEGQEYSTQKNIWNYDRSDEYPTIASFDVNNDTIGLSYPEFDNKGNLICETDISEGGNFITQFTYDKGKETSLVMIDNIDKSSIKVFKEYYENGDIKRELHINENIKTER